MIDIIKTKDNIIYYKCSCGTMGICSIKPLDHDAAIVVVVKCPLCNEAEKITILQYSSEEVKEDLIENLNEADFFWSLSFNEEV